MARTPNRQKLHRVVLEFSNSVTRTVEVRAASRETAEKRALKRNPKALRVKV